MVDTNGKFWTCFLDCVVSGQSVFGLRGFLPVVKEVLDQGKMGGQRLLFSATLDGGVDSPVPKNQAESLTLPQLLNLVDLLLQVENDQDRIQVKGEDGQGRPFR
jgi:hypothetical protein